MGACVFGLVAGFGSGGFRAVALLSEKLLFGVGASPKHVAVIWSVFGHVHAVIWVLMKILSSDLLALKGFFGR